MHSLQHLLQSMVYSTGKPCHILARTPICVSLCSVVLSAQLLFIVTLNQSRYAADLPEVPRPGLGITPVSRCIWFGGLPRNLPESELLKEVRPMGQPQLILFPDCPANDEALVTFETFGCVLLFCLMILRSGASADGICATKTVQACL